MVSIFLYKCQVTDSMRCLQLRQLLYAVFPSATPPRHMEFHAGAMIRAQERWSKGIRE